jgi:hypothetical protein
MLPDCSFQAVEKSRWSGRSSFGEPQLSITTIGLPAAGRAFGFTTKLNEQRRYWEFAESEKGPQDRWRKLVRRLSTRSG